jgi:hypothetical protein
MLALAEAGALDCTAGVFWLCDGVVCAGAVCAGVFCAGVLGGAPHNQLGAPPNARRPALN